MVRSPRFEPGSSAWQASFERWIRAKRFRGSWERTVLSNVRRYGHCLFNGDLSVLAGLSDGLRPNALKSLSALAKFFGCYEWYMGLVKSYGLKWVGRSSDDLLIDRLVRARSCESVYVWVRMVEARRPELHDFLRLMVVTGLRLVEAVESYNLIIQLSGKNRLSEYYNVESEALEHFRFKTVFIRRSKKAFVSFVPTELVEQIGKRERLSVIAIYDRLKKEGLHMRFSDIREAHGTLLTKYLTPPEIDFLHGRVSSSVFMRNYFNPALIGDLKKRTFQAVEMLSP